MRKPGRQNRFISYALFLVYLIAFLCFKIGQITTLFVEALVEVPLHILFRTHRVVKHTTPNKEIKFPFPQTPKIKLTFIKYVGDFFSKELDNPIVSIFIFLRGKISFPKIPEIHKPAKTLPTQLFVIKPLAPRKRGRPRKFRLSGIFKLRYVAVFLIVALFAYSYFLLKIATELPSPDRLTTSTRPLTTEIYDRNGNLIYQFYESRNRKLVQLSDLPPYLIDATVSVEDKHFFTHPGFDITAILRAIKANASQNDNSLQGASTITQQLVKNILLSQDQTFSRKMKEIILAFWAERIYSKQQILQMYFNEIPYGGQAWGVEAAAESYFGKSAHDLDLAESAYLAGLPAAPSEYSPYGSNPELGKERQKEVLSRMVEDHYLTQKQADAALAEDLTFKPEFTDLHAPHFVMYVRSLIAEKYGERTASEGGLKIVTTLDPDIQRMAEQVVANDVSALASLNVGNGAAMVTDAQTGEILAMVGSKNYQDPNGGNFNVTLALRQPGSSIKPVTYATAFKQGMSPGTVLLDTPTTFSNPWGQAYSPVNYDRKFHGPVTIRTALGSSFNIPAVKTLAIVGIPNMLQTAQDLGITTLTDIDNYGLSLTLGGGAVKMIDMMSAYGTFADSGVRHTPQAILTVTDPDGVILEDNRNPEGQRALTEQVAYLINSILSDNNARVPAFGPHSLLEIPGHVVAVKTGTSDDKRDNWAFGYTPKYVVGAWVGNNDNSAMDPRLTSGITGATPIWHDIMTNLLGDEPDLAFNRPAGIIDTTVDGNHDIAIAGQIPKSIVGFRTIKQKDDSGNEKDVVTYSDPFTSFIADKSKPNP